MTRLTVTLAAIAILLPVVASAQEPITFNGRPLSSAVEVWTLQEPAAPAPDEPEPTRQGGRPIVIAAVAGALAGCVIGIIVASDDSGGPGAGTLCAVVGLIWGGIGAGIGLVVKTIRSHLAPSRQWYWLSLMQKPVPAPIPTRYMMSRASMRRKNRPPTGQSSAAPGVDAHGFHPVDVHTAVATVTRGRRAGSGPCAPEGAVIERTTANAITNRWIMSSFTG